MVVGDWTGLKLVGEVATSVTNSVWKRRESRCSIIRGTKRPLLLDTGPIMLRERVIHLAGTAGQWLDNARTFDRATF